jgi:hypothetical protein
LMAAIRFGSALEASGRRHNLRRGVGSFGEMLKIPGCARIFGELLEASARRRKALRAVGAYGEELESSMCRWKVIAARGSFGEAL